MTTWTFRRSGGPRTSTGRGSSCPRLADDGQDEAPARVDALLREGGAPRPRFWVLGFGEAREVPAAARTALVAG
jgi:hypothetical protein